ncbi:hypothetical protein HanHA300_Chr15g0560861 [Helianthus annuus]|nr:hypothetical protein HanHA300_Chr15g0560861 [Helianthus annuus]KAJ0472710.1 hypothetical protein HanHA89_Chr15g0610101 [Helianthus annuus]
MCNLKMDFKNTCPPLEIQAKFYYKYMRTSQHINCYFFLPSDFARHPITFFKLKIFFYIILNKSLVPF